MKTIDIERDQMPALGLGTWQLRGAGCVRAVRHALDLGYRHIDTAQAYDNEEQVGEAIASSGVEREEIFLTTKVWWEHLRMDQVLETTRRSLERLRTDYVDLLLIHWPPQDLPLDEPLAALTTLEEEGRARHIGVSNFTPDHLSRALQAAPVACNQVEYHPLLSQDELLRMARRNRLVLTAYSPLARGRVLQEPLLEEIGRRHGKSAAQVSLRWLLQQDRVAAIPKAASPEHRVSNLDVFDFELSDDEMARISGLARGERVIDPDFAPAWGESAS